MRNKHTISNVTLIIYLFVCLFVFYFIFFTKNEILRLTEQTRKLVFNSIRLAVKLPVYIKTPNGSL